MSQTIQAFNSILKSFKIKAECVSHKEIDNYFYYDLKLYPETKVKDITKFGDEISLMLKALTKPSVKIMRREGLVRLEFASPRTVSLNLFDIFTNRNVPKGDIICLLGQTVDGSRIWMDLANNPHMIIAGTTGSGKSVLLHNIIANILNYNDVSLYLVDPKLIEFNKYKKIKKITVIEQYNETISLFKNLLNIMETRYESLRKDNQVKFKPIVVIVDEFADIIMQDKDQEFYNLLCRLAQKCRAAKIHIILSTQRPSVNIVNGTIKANFPARIACRTASHIDSKVILDCVGAENLMGNGDALLKDNNRNLERFQVAYTNVDEVVRYFSEN